VTLNEKLLSEDDKKAIAEAIRKAEATTSGEIVFALTEASARYRHASFQGAIAGVVVSAAVYLALPITHSIALLLWVQLVSFALFYALFEISPLRRWFISGEEMDARVHDAALLEFYNSGLYRTREENGVLIYLSVFERRVVVLGDRGIHNRMGNPHWNEVRDRIIRGIRAGRAREGICEAIDLCGKALAQHFPRRADDVNELSNQVLDRKLKPGAS
jgi:putative membrane protein